MLLADYRACLGAFLLTSVIYYLYYSRYRRPHYYLYYSRYRRPHPYPPGPKGLPILRNLFDLPHNSQWAAYAAWAKEAGSPIISLDMIKAQIIVLNDKESITHVLERRGGLYSERPRMPYMEAAGFDWNWAFTGGSEKWKICRREFDIHFRQIASRRYHPQELRMAHMLLNKFLVSPEYFMDHCRYATSSLMLDIGYGIHAKFEDDARIDITEIGSSGLEKAGDKNIINLIPWIQHSPLCLSWLPGMGWRADIDAFKKWGLRVREIPFLHVKQQLAAGTASLSMATQLLEKLQDEWPELKTREDLVKDIVGTTYVGGSDTTLSLLRFFILAMVIFPEVQYKAQKALDTVLGPGRLPHFSDEDHLSYITAISREVLRWTSPTAIPHSNARDDVISGYFIPKGSIILANTWAILHDPQIFPQPERFYPERFLTADGRLDPFAPDIMGSFGYGRRICPGRFLALDSLWISIASILATFNIGRAVGPDGKEIVPPADIGSGLINHPKPFPCVIEPRSEQAASLIKACLNEDS